MNRKLILAIGLGGLVALVLLAWLFPHPTPKVFGKLSGDEVARIQKATWSDVRRQSRPTPSWRSLKQWPRWLGLLVAGRIREIHVLPGNDFAQVRVGSVFGDYFYVFRRGDAAGGTASSDDWRLFGRAPHPMVAFVGSRYNGPESFGRNLSFGAAADAMESAPVGGGTDPGATAAVIPLSHPDFSASLSNHAKLTLGP